MYCGDRQVLNNEAETNITEKFDLNPYKCPTFCTKSLLFAAKIKNKSVNVLIHRRICKVYLKLHLFNGPLPCMMFSAKIRHDLYELLSHKHLAQNL